MQNSRLNAQQMQCRQPALNCLPVKPDRPIPGLLQDAHEGLLEAPRCMPPKYFYDARGSRLFDAICDTPEYYPTRTEEAMLERHAREIISAVQPEHIVEFGSGTSRKTRHLLAACGATNTPVTYWPFDVCESVLAETGQALLDDYDWLRVKPLVGDYHGGLNDLPALDGTCLYLFLGGTIGNFEHGTAGGFLSEVCARMQRGDFFLLGADRIKHPKILHAAYNDAAGITAEFNLNLLNVLNRELGADFDPDGFSHKAIYNPDAEQIEMYLVSDTEQCIHLGVLEQVIRLQPGEHILTEISRKFSRESLLNLVEGAGLSTERHFEAEDDYYSLLLAEAAREV